MKYILKDLKSYVPQGICEINKKYYITMYDSNHELNSKIRIYDLYFENYEEVLLNNKCHLGGIAYDKKNNKIWLTETNSLSRYDINLKKEKEFIIKDIINSSNQNSIAYVTINDNKLYCGNFTLSKKENPILKEYIIDKDNLILYDTKQFYNKVQGLFFKDDTMYVSTSYGRHNKSHLIINEKEIEMPPLMEQILINHDDKLVMLFECNAEKYKTSKKSYDIIIKDV